MMPSRLAAGDGRSRSSRSSRVMRRLRACLAIVLPAACAIAAHAGDRVDAHDASASAQRIEADVRILADDRMAGRAIGSEGLDRALRMTAERFAEIGLLPAFPERASGKDRLAGYFQPFVAEGKPASANVVGILRRTGGQAGGEASRDLDASVVVIGAHADHLGVDPNSSAQDRIFNGADDNASGVAALLEIARALSGTVGQPGDRGIVFVVFSGEESGLLGSRYFVEHRPAAARHPMVMLNLDSVGRLRDRQLIVFGAATAQEFDRALRGVNQRFGFDLVLRRADSGASDQTSFVTAGVPGLHFFTGAHADYSKVSDEADGVNFAGVAQVADFVSELARYLSYRQRPLTFVAPKRETGASAAAAAGPPPGAVGSPPAGQSQGPQARRGSLGFMPDFATEGEGVKVGPVSPGGAAEAAGIQAGDTIVALDGEPVASLAEYAAMLRQYGPGDQVIVSVLRGGSKIDLPAIVQERK